MSTNTTTTSETIVVTINGTTIRVERTDGEERVWVDGVELDADSPEGREAIRRADEAAAAARRRSNSLIDRLRKRFGGLF